MSRNDKTQRPGAMHEPETSLSTSTPARAEYDLLISCASSVSAERLRSDGSYVLGRSAEADIVLNDPSVSRRHARLWVTREGVRIEDLGSSNGSRVGGRVLSPGVGELLPIGLVAELGGATVVVQRGRGPSSLPQPEPQRPSQPGAVDQSRRIVLDPTMQRVYAMLDLVAPTTLSVLVLGETGVGKEVFAQEIHERSARARAPFLQLNCAALPPSTLEAELFGFEKGAFTGAVASKPGLFEVATGGTVFLDEIGDMPLATQVKILRVLESGDVLRVGAVKPIRVDVRLVSATNRDLAAAMEAGSFRSDLYFRLNGMTFTLPPLRHRRVEIGPLARRFIDLFAVRLGRPRPSLPEDVVAMLETRVWPGNVRELRNVVERAVVLSAGASELRLEHFPSEVVAAPVGTPARSPVPGEPPLAAGSPPPEAGFEPEATTGRWPTAPGAAGLESTPNGSRDLNRELRELERQRIVEALRAAGGNQSQAARALGISRGLLIGRMKLFGLGSSRSKRDGDGA